MWGAAPRPTDCRAGVKRHRRRHLRRPRAAPGRWLRFPLVTAVETIALCRGAEMPPSHRCSLFFSHFQSVVPERAGPRAQRWPAAAGPAPKPQSSVWTARPARKQKSPLVGLTYLFSGSRNAQSGNLIFEGTTVAKAWSICHQTGERHVTLQTEPPPPFLLPSFPFRFPVSLPALPSLSVPLNRVCRNVPGTQLEPLRKGPDACSSKSCASFMFVCLFVF